MPIFHIQWRVTHGGDTFVAKCDVNWSFVPAPGISVDPFPGAAPVEVKEVYINLNGTEGQLVLESFETPEEERFRHLQRELSRHAWAVNA